MDRDTLLDGKPAREYISYDPPRPLSDWIEDGNVVPGHTPSGFAFPWHVMSEPKGYVVIGEERYSDGRWFLDFGISRAFIEATSDFQQRGNKLVWVCPDCGAAGDNHVRVEIKGVLTRCPRDPGGRR